MTRTRWYLLCALASAIVLTALVAASAKVRPTANPATRAIIANLPRRFRLLKPGMPEAQIWKVLGMPAHAAGFLGAGSGPPSAYSTVYWVGPYNLCIVIDSGRFPHGVLKSYPARLKSAALYRRSVKVASVG